MASQQQLKEANYVHRGDEGKYIEGLGQCSFSPCDHSKIVKDERTGEEYRYCMKLQIPVDDYDSCKYHSEERWIGLMGEMANLLKEENDAKKKQTPPQNKKHHFLLMFVVICVCLLIYILIK